MKRKDLRSYPIQAEACIRQSAVEAVLKGESQQHVAEMFGIQRVTVSKWMRQWR